MVLTHCVARTRGALQPAAPRTKRSRAAGAFDSTVANKRSFAIIIIAIISNAASQTGSALAKGFYVRSDRSVLAQARRGGEPHLGEWRPRAVLLEEMDQSGLTAA